MAKTFYTSGTGSQQTLTGSQDEKVAVYQTLADAEADLANLEAGQIVATPDTGDENAQPVDVIQAGNMHAVTSNVVANAKYTNIFNKLLSVSGWYKIATFQRRNVGASISIDLFTGYYYHNNSSHKIQVNFGWQKAEVLDFAQDELTVFDKIRMCYNTNNVDDVAIYVHYSKGNQNPAWLNINAGTFSLTPVNFETDSLTWQNTIEYNLGANGLYVNGQKVTCLKEKQIRIDDTSGYVLQDGVYVKTLLGFFADNGIDYAKVVNIRQVNNGNYLYPYFFIAYGGGDSLKVFKFANINNTYVDIKVYYE